MKIRGIVISGICLLAACVTLLHWNTAGATVRLSDAEMGAVWGKHLTGCPCTGQDPRQCSGPHQCITCAHDYQATPTNVCLSAGKDFSQKALFQCVGATTKTCYVGLLDFDCYRNWICNASGYLNEDSQCFTEADGAQMCEVDEEEYEDYWCKQCFYIPGTAGSWVTYKNELCK